MIYIYIYVCIIYEAKTSMKEIGAALRKLFPDADEGEEGEER